MAQFIRDVHEAQAALGTGEKVPQPSELETRVVARRSIVAARDLAAGDVLAPADLAIKRPGDGLPPSQLEAVLGRRLAQPIGRDERLTPAHLA
jgi:sialic acid synthase SpsE